ncbi:hypothetical protein F383_03313 [Gossypium arboreum]|uniref:Uncharacterized protein n=1 Tax=Gossypium arboreum TaxID=29729 RepID=A0A0B0P4M7_GOSAR|nr:hypothetical protein F383_03313 [Gossypium arboreum]
MFCNYICIYTYNKSKHKFKKN